MKCKDLPLFYISLNNMKCKDLTLFYISLNNMKCKDLLLFYISLNNRKCKELTLFYTAPPMYFVYDYITTCHWVYETNPFPISLKALYHVQQRIYRLVS